MARVNELLNISGTVSNLVFYQRNGVNYIRSKPKKYRDAKTEKQLSARGRFAGCNRFYDKIKVDIFKQVWKIAANGTGKNAKNIFTQRNIYAFGKDKEVIDYGRLHFSFGLLPLPDHIQVEQHNNRDCLLQWEYDPAKAIGTPNDLLYIVELRPEKQPKDQPKTYTTVFHETGISRSKGKALFSTSSDFDDQTYLYCFWGNEQNSSFSDSYYLKDIKLIEP
ncbi:MAG: DUF6266 family protein [Tannerella sp.]|jgi:hypothetical protein|nr:DUF6266 family protein [Tannerella sp.]